MRSWLPRAALPVVLAALPALTTAGQARAQSLGDIALNRLDPPPAGDPFFSLPSPSTGGHAAARVAVAIDHAEHPLLLTEGGTTLAVVERQTFLHLGVAVSFWERLLLSMDVPVALAQSGESPSRDRVIFGTSSSGGLGDLRFDARVRLLGEDTSPVQAGVETNLYLPTGPAGEFIGEGAVRLLPRLLLGGRAGPVVWSASLGSLLRGSRNAPTLTYGAGIAALFWEKRLRVGPEVVGATDLEKVPIRVTEGKEIDRGPATAVEVLLGARVRITGGLTFGAAGGAGLTRALGSPSARLIASLTWTPAWKRAKDPTADTDADGIKDAVDACALEFGYAHAVPRWNGCLPVDRDDDGVPDADDVCPDTAGPPGAWRGPGATEARWGCPEPYHR